MAPEPVEARRRTVARAAATAAERFGDRVALRHREGGEWRERTFAEVGELVDELALGLVALGLEPGDRACILANTRPEWTFTSAAISAPEESWSRSIPPTRPRSASGWLVTRRLE